MKNVLLVNTPHGEFAMVKKKVYEKALRALRSGGLSLRAHPDCKPNSEFADISATIWEAYDELNDVKEEVRDDS